MLIDRNNESFFILTDENDSYRGYQFKTGYNSDDNLSFEGFPICSFSSILNFREIFGNVKYIRKILFSPSTIIYADKHYYRADKFILEDKELFYLPESLCLEAVKKYYWNIDYVKEEHRTPEIYMEFHKQKGEFLF